MAKKHWESYYGAVKNQNWKKALDSLNSILKEDPKNSQVHLKVGDVFQKIGDIQNAIKAYQQSAWIIVNEGFLQKALAIYKIILRLDPNNHEAINKSKELLMELEGSRIKAVQTAPSMEPAFIETTEQEPEAEMPDETETVEEEKVEVESMPSMDDFFAQKPLDEEPAAITPPLQEETPDLGLPLETEFKLGEDKNLAVEAPSEIEFGMETEQEKVSSEADDFFAQKPSGEESIQLTSPLQEETGELGLPVEPGIKPESGQEIEAGSGDDTEFGLEIEQRDETQISQAIDDLFVKNHVEEKSGLIESSVEFQEGAEIGLPVETTGEEIEYYIPSFLSSMPEEEAKQLIETIKPQSFSSCQAIIKEGDTGDSVFSLNKGKAKVVANILGKEIELAFLDEGDTFGEVAFLTGRPRTASVIAVDDLEVIEFDRPLLEKVLEKYPETLKRLEDFYHSHVQDTLEKVRTRLKK